MYLESSICLLHLHIVLCFLILPPSFNINCVCLVGFAPTYEGSVAKTHMTTSFIHFLVT